MSEYGAPPPNDPNQPPPYQPPPPPPGAPSYGSAPGSAPGYGPGPGYGQAPGTPPGPPAYGTGPGYPQGFGAPVTGPVPADMGKRLLARIIDGVLIGIAYTILFTLFFAGGAATVQVDPVTGELNSAGRGFVASLFIGFALLGVLGIAYEVVMIALRGATVGKQLMGIKVVLERDGSVPGWMPSVLRWVIPQAAGWVTCGLGTLIVYLSPFFDSAKRNQGWHDKVASTLVVNAR